jgi:hypothetical protein
VLCGKVGYVQRRLDMDLMDELEWAFQTLRDILEMLDTRKSKNMGEFPLSCSWERTSELNLQRIYLEG